jgi:copper chaperone CopZ
MDEEERGAMREEIKIEGMSCQHCVAAVKKALESMKGLTEVRVELDPGQASFSRSDTVSLDQVKRTVEDAGYRVVG